MMVHLVLKKIILRRVNPAAHQERMQSESATSSRNRPFGVEKSEWLAMNNLSDGLSLLLLPVGSERVGCRSFRYT